MKEECHNNPGERIPVDLDHVIDLAAAREERGTDDGPRSWTPSELLERVSLLLNSTLDLREVLLRLAELALGATDAQRCSVFLLDARILRPMVSIGLRADDELWDAFQEMGPIRLAEVRVAWKHVSKGDPLAIEDASETNWVPRRWVTRFDVGAALVVPLLAVDEPCGVMVVDYAQPRTFTADEVSLLRTVGNYAGIAVRNARLYEAAERRARLQEALARSAGSLLSDDGSAAVARSLVDAYCDLLQVPACAIGLFDRRMQHITTVAARGGTTMRGPIPFSEVPEHVVERLTETWTEQMRPVSFHGESWFADMVGGDHVTDHLLLPLGVNGRARGAVVLGLEDGRHLDAEERQAAKALAEIAAAVLDRTVLLDRLERNVSRLEILHELSAFLVEEADSRDVVERLNGLLAGHDVEVESIAFRDGDLRTIFAADAMVEEEIRACEQESKWPLTDDGHTVLPLRLDDRTVGALRVDRRDLDPDEASFLEAVGRGIAELASRGSLRARLVAAAREQAAAAERERIASDLHDTIAQQFVAIGLEARRAADQLPEDSPWSDRFARLADLARRGKWDIDQTVRALSFVPTRGGLVRGLRDLAESFRLDSGLDIFLEVDGAPGPMEADAEQVLYRVAHEALSSAWGNARCTVIRIGLRFDDDEVVLRIRDDGVDLSSRSTDEFDGGDLVGIRRLVTRVGGRLDVSNADPRGVLVEAAVARESPTEG